MKIIVPTAPDVDPIAATVLESQGYHPDVRPTGGRDGYVSLIEHLWSERETFVIVEHDIIPWPGAIDEMWACPAAWCAFPYLLSGGYDAALGCTKFDETLMRAVHYPYTERPDRWQNAEWIIARVRDAVGFLPHRHAPPVTHLNRIHFPEPGDPRYVDDETRRRVWDGIAASAG